MTDKPSNKTFCPTCSENVDVYEAQVEENLEYRCVFCGQVLQREAMDKIKGLSMVLTAEDSPLLREMLKDVLLEKKMSRKVETSENGQEVIERLTKLLRDKEVPGAIILDVIMPVINGFFTALAIRGIEKGFQTEKPIPIIFLSARDLDQNFKSVIQYCQPCYYIQKSSENEGPAGLGQKIEEVLSKIK
jgi:CheY-like chemotaxis protein